MSRAQLQEIDIGPDTGAQCAPTNTRRLHLGALPEVLGQVPLPLVLEPFFQASHTLGAHSSRHLLGLSVQPEAQGLRCLTPLTNASRCSGGRFATIFSLIAAFSSLELSRLQAWQKGAAGQRGIYSTLNFDHSAGQAGKGPGDMPGPEPPGGSPCRSPKPPARCCLQLLAQKPEQRMLSATCSSTPIGSQRQRRDERPAIRWRFIASSIPFLIGASGSVDPDGLSVALLHPAPPLSSRCSSCPSRALRLFALAVVALSTSE